MRWLKRLALAALILLVVAGVALLAGGPLAERMTGRPLPVLWDKAQERWAHRYPSLFEPARPWIERYVAWFDRSVPRLDRAVPDPESWRGRGADPTRPFEPPGYTETGLPLPRGAPGPFAEPPLRTLRPADTRALLQALEQARAGDEIVPAPGSYDIATHAIRLGEAGTPRHPVVVRAERLGEVRLRLDTVEGFYVARPFWVFENLDVAGVCEAHPRCDHAFHVVGARRSTILRNNRVHDFNSANKVNGARDGDAVVYPDHGLIEGNSLYNLSIRDTDAPVTLVDIVAADGWVVRDNLIADFVKGHGDRTSYGAFIKGNATGGVIERNLVVCALRRGPRDDGADSRVGLSLGGGGTAAQGCRDERCEVESTGAVLRNNVILHCPDAGIYLNRARDARIVHNTLFATWGIDGRFPETRAVARYNVYTGWISEHDGARIATEGNLDAGQGRDFRDPANGDFTLSRRRVVDRAGGAEAEDDFCGVPRPAAAADIGAFEYGDADSPACATLD